MGTAVGGCAATCDSGAMVGGVATAGFSSLAFLAAYSLRPERPGQLRLWTEGGPGGGARGKSMKIVVRRGILRAAANTYRLLRDDVVERPVVRRGSVAHAQTRMYEKEGAKQAYLCPHSDDLQQ